jgi:hypothetical protein
MQIDATQNLESSEDKNEELSLRDQIESAKAEIESANNEPEKSPIKPVEVEESPKDDGKESQNETETKPVPVVEDVAAPNSWNKEAREKWADIPVEAKRYIAEREAQMHRAITAQDELKEAGKAIRELVQPFSPLFKEIGQPAPDLIRGYLQTEETLRRGSPEQKAGLMANVLRSYGVDLGLLSQAIGNPQPVPQLDPRVQSLEQRIAQFEENTRLQQEAEKISVIESFLSDNSLTDESIDQEFIAHIGLTKSMNPNLSERQILDKAWENYSWGNPAHRQKLIEKQVAESTKSEKVLRAKKAGSSVSGSPGAGSIQEKPAESLREELERNFSRAARV